MMLNNAPELSIWRRQLCATRTSAHIAFAVVVWPVLTILGATFAIADMPYYSVSLRDAFGASVAGTLLSGVDMAVVGAIVFGISGWIFNRFGIDTSVNRVGFVRLGFEPFLTFVAVVFGASLWYPALLSKPLLFALR